VSNFKLERDSKLNRFSFLNLLKVSEFQKTSFTNVSLKVWFIILIVVVIQSFCAMSPNGGYKACDFRQFKSSVRKNFLTPNQIIYNYLLWIQPIIFSFTLKYWIYYENSILCLYWVYRELRPDKSLKWTKNLKANIFNCYLTSIIINPHDNVSNMNSFKTRWE
jgi:hypothetical protein